MANSNRFGLSDRLQLAWRAFQWQPRRGKVSTPSRIMPHRRPTETREQFISRTMAEFFKEDAVTGMAASGEWSGYGATERDKPLPRRMEDLSNALAAWRTNPLARRLVNLTRDHVWGKGLHPISKNKTIQKWIDSFWNHDLNLMDERWPAWIDALTMDGEVFPTFFQSTADGMTLCRALPATQIEEIHWQPGDYEQLTEFGQRVSSNIELKWWPSLLFAKPGEPCCWQYAVNKPVGIIRGDGDLTPALPWLGYYSDWLEDRVERNAALTKFYYDVSVENASDVDNAKTRYASPPADGTVVVHSASEKHSVIQPHIEADDAKADGYAIKLMVAAGGNIPIHWLSEPGEGSSEATSNNMNDVSYRHYETRQAYVKRRIAQLTRFAYRRAVEAHSIRKFGDDEIKVSASDISREDNQKLAAAAKDVATAFSLMIEKGLDRDRKLVSLIYRFAGEDLDEAEIAEIVARAERRADQSENPDKGAPTPKANANVGGAPAEKGSNP